jgi:hypothetical protein
VDDYIKTLDKINDGDSVLIDLYDKNNNKLTTVEFKKQQIKVSGPYLLKQNNNIFKIIINNELEIPNVTLSGDGEIRSGNINTKLKMKVFTPPLSKSFDSSGSFNSFYSRPSSSSPSSFGSSRSSSSFSNNTPLSTTSTSSSLRSFKRAMSEAEKYVWNDNLNDFDRISTPRSTTSTSSISSFSSSFK